MIIMDPQHIWIFPACDDARRFGNGIILNETPINTVPETRTISLYREAEYCNEQHSIEQGSHRPESFFM
jgi:hypothetical protein